MGCYMQSTRNLSAGGPLVVHASKMYTFKVFSMFVEIKNESEYYFVDGPCVGGQYIVQHYNLEKVQRWCKGRYKVRVSTDGSMFSCECGLFEHFGLPCCHSMRVSVFRLLCAECTVCFILCGNSLVCLLFLGDDFHWT